MAIRYLKESKSQSERREDDAKVKGIVEDTLRDIEARGDAAIRELSEKFDEYSPASFKCQGLEGFAMVSIRTNKPRILKVGRRSRPRFATV